VSSLAEHMHRFIALDRPLRHGKCPTSQPRIEAVFHTPMILCSGIVQGLAWPEYTGLAERPEMRNSVGRWLA
jgi:hypothetical protein